MVAGTFDTEFGNNAIFGTEARPEAYKGSMTEVMIHMIKEGKLQPNSDKEKGMRALYEVIVGEGVGQGKEAETLLLLGKDMDARARKTIGNLSHTLEVFGAVTNAVVYEKK